MLQQPVLRRQRHTLTFGGPNAGTSTAKPTMAAASDLHKHYGPITFLQD